LNVRFAATSKKANKINTRLPKTQNSVSKIGFEDLSGLGRQTLPSQAMPRLGTRLQRCQGRAFGASAQPIFDP